MFNLSPLLFFCSIQWPRFFVIHTRRRLCAFRRRPRRWKAAFLGSLNPPPTPALPQLPTLHLRENVFIWMQRVLLSYFFPSLTLVLSLFKGFLCSFFNRRLPSLGHPLLNQFSSGSSVLHFSFPTTSRLFPFPCPLSHKTRTPPKPGVLMYCPP